jgi:L-alanine-DL-glutamate epimerase-like enolase superfamily enzyme
VPDAGAEVDGLDVAAYTVPTDEPESDGTLSWDSTTIVVVEAHGGGETGLGYTYGPAAAASVVEGMLADVGARSDALAPQQAWTSMRAALRNAGQQGIGALALSAVDIALHDLRARLLGVSLATALGAFREEVPVYGSGGFTSYSLARLREQLGGWSEQGLGRVKMKVGRDPAADHDRLGAAREAIGDEATLMVDANGAFTPPQAIAWAAAYREAGVDWFEEPVSSDDVAGLARVRDASPAGMSVAAGEYAWSLFDAQRLLDGGAVDVLQADVTRCGGPTELLRIDALARARNRPFSAHCAPAVSAHAGCAMESLIHLEYFHDHVRLERMLFDGVLEPEEGALRPASDTPGLGLELRRQDAERYRVA